MEGYFFPTLLLLVAGALLLGEAFFTSGGLAVVAGAVYLASVTWAFIANGPVGGSLFFVASLAGSAIVAALVIRWAPYSPLGRLIFARPPKVDYVEEQRRALEMLVGRTGMARCPMMPGGIVYVEGASYDAISEAGAIDNGEPVQVVAVRGRTLVVRRADPSALAPRRTRDAARSPSPFDTLVVDPFDDAN